MEKEILGIEIHQIWLSLLGGFFFGGILVLLSMINVGSSWMWYSLAVIIFIFMVMGLIKIDDYIQQKRAKTKRMDFERENIKRRQIGKMIRILGGIGYLIAIVLLIIGEVL